MLEPQSEAPMRAATPGVAIISPDRRVRDGLTSLLTASRRARIVGAVADPAAALALLAASVVDTVVLDLAVDHGSDRQAFLEALREHAPGARILLISWDGLPIPRPGERVDGVLDVAGHPAHLVDAIVDGAGSAGPDAL